MKILGKYLENNLKIPGKHVKGQKVLGKYLENSNDSNDKSYLRCQDSADP